MRRAASVRLLRDAFVERRHDGGLLLFREALGRLFREHASIATQELSFQTEDGHEDAAEDGVGAVEYGEHIGRRRRADALESIKSSGCVS